ncbi:hypothetical protein PI125_g25485 [Phytophthora idaei]|nr:hypothetical protein PI125_g25485 [Phytophthora idaei]
MVLCACTTLVKVNYEDKTSLKVALVGSEVVVSSINSQHHAAQFVIARAAKAASIQLFVPTEFGFRDEDGANITKQKWTVDRVPAILAGVQRRRRRHERCRRGRCQVEYLGARRFVAHVLVTAPKSSIKWARLSVETGRMSPKEIAAHLEKKSGKKLQLKAVDYEETKKGYDTNPVAYIQTRIADGSCVPGTEEEVKATIAKFFPDWNPSPWEGITA